jgi:predicted PurR-regulated permease PerM
MPAPTEERKITPTVIILAGFVIILAGLKAGASILGPVLLAVFFAVLFGMISRWLERKGAPRWVAILAAIVLFLIVLAAFFLLVVSSFVRLIAQMPTYQSSIEQTLTAVFSGIGIPMPSLGTFVSLVSQYSLDALSGLVSGITAVALIVIATLFLLVEANSFSAKIEAMLADNPTVLGYFTSLGQKIVSYIIIRTEVNMVTGFGIGLIIAAVGVEYAVFWGFLAFALSFIPYIGFALAVIPPVLIAWSEIGLAQAAVILVGATIINLFAENILFPGAAGRGLKVSPAVVFISIVLWGYILGGIGVLLAVPLTLALIMFLEYFDETRTLAMLLGPSDFVRSELGAEQPGDGDSESPEEIQRYGLRPPG